MPASYPSKDNSIPTEKTFPPPPSRAPHRHSTKDDPPYADSPATKETYTRPTLPWLADLPRPKLGRVPYNTVQTLCKEPDAIALTFDDGPWKYTEDLLDLLEEHNASATFFVCGGNMDGDGQLTNPGYPALVRRMVRQGHQVGSHSWAHADLAALEEDDILEQVLLNEQALVETIGVIPTYFRPPYFSLDDEVLEVVEGLGYHVVTAAVDTEDWMGDYEAARRTFDDSTRSPFGEGKPGFIVLAHDILERTVYELAEYMIERAEEKGYRLVTLGECLGDSKQNWYRDSMTGESWYGDDERGDDRYMMERAVVPPPDVPKDDGPSESDDTPGLRHKIHLHTLPPPGVIDEHHDRIVKRAEGHQTTPVLASTSTSAMSTANPTGAIDENFTSTHTIAKISCKRPGKSCQVVFKTVTRIASFAEPTSDPRPIPRRSFITTTTTSRHPPTAMTTAMVPFPCRGGQLYPKRSKMIQTRALGGEEVMVMSSEKERFVPDPEVVEDLTEELDDMEEGHFHGEETRQEGEGQGQEQSEEQNHSEQQHQQEKEQEQEQEHTAGFNATATAGQSVTAGAVRASLPDSQIPNVVREQPVLAVRSLVPLGPHYITHDLLTSAQHIHHPVPQASSVGTIHTPPVDLPNPDVDNRGTPTDHYLAPPACEGCFLGVKDVLQHPQDDGVVDEEVDRPVGVCADGLVLALRDSVLAQDSEHGFDGEDVVVQGRAMRNILDPGDDVLVWQGRGRNVRVVLGPAGVLPSQLCGYNLGVGSVDQVPPCVGDEAGCVVVCGVVNEKGEVVVVSWLGEAIKELFVDTRKDGTIQSLLTVRLAIHRDPVICPQPLQQIVLNVRDLEHGCNIMVKNLLVLPADTDRRHAGIAFGPAKQGNSLLDADYERLVLCQVSLHLSGLIETPTMRVEPAKQVGVAGVCPCDSLEESDDVRGVNGQDAVRPILRDVPLVQVKVEDLVVGAVDYSVGLSALCGCKSESSIYQFWLKS
ncbi:Bifunctional xylanase/deacetylase [Cytospora mali]|uniref:Bifunctional xylanase/deacetylase n=1 Tax=Cytospora mali TaxID=578113 RepID=A0A194USA2_CYTMA|nr:Bifunctional xylanase/deacetylase [Valsa mali var. pyri (nom. inval.)]